MTPPISEQSSLAAWSDSLDLHASQLQHALERLAQKLPAETNAEVMMSLSDADVEPLVDDGCGSQTFRLDVHAFTFRLQMKLVVTHEGWLLWEAKSFPVKLLEPLASHLLLALKRGHRAERGPCWTLTSWGLSSLPARTSFERLQDEAALQEGRFQLAKFSGMNVSVLGVA